MSCDNEQYLKGYSTAKSKYLKEITKIKKEYESKHVDYTQVFPYNLIEAMNDEWHEMDMPYCAMFLKETIAQNLTDREQRILSLRYEHGFNLEETGKEFGVTRERIRQIEARAIRKLRHPSLAFKYKAVPLEKWREVYSQNQKLKDENEQMRQMLNIKEKEEEKELKKRVIGLEELDLSVRSYNCLKRAGINSLNDLIIHTEEWLDHVRNLGKRSKDEIIQKVKEMGFSMYGQ